MPSEKKYILAKMKEYEYFWKFRYHNGHTKIIGSYTEKAPSAIAVRVGNMHSWGPVVGSEPVPKEYAINQFKKEADDEERLIKAKKEYVKGNLDIKKEDPEASRTYAEKLYTLHEIDGYKSMEPVVPVIPAMPEIPETPRATFMESESSLEELKELYTDQEADNELLNLNADLEASLTELLRMSNKFFGLMALSSDDDGEADADILNTYIKHIQQKLGVADDIVARMTDNLQGV